MILANVPNIRQLRRMLEKPKPKRTPNLVKDYTLDIHIRHPIATHSSVSREIRGDTMPPVEEVRQFYPLLVGGKFITASKVTRKARSAGCMYGYRKM